MNTAVVDPEATYYLSGPMTGIDKFNYPYFERVARRLRAWDLVVYSPHEIPTPPTELQDRALWDWCMAECMKQMDKCDAIVLLSGWPTSRGAKTELQIALKRDFQVYFYLDNPGRLINMTRRV